MHKYVKIETPYERDMHGTKKLIEGVFRNETVEYLQNNTWSWTEKIDGTNIGVVWDGHNVQFQGRTEQAQIPAPLANRLNELFSGNETEELFEQMFGGSQVILFGEGYGRKIQKVGSLYLPDRVDFILFDVYFPENNLWLRRESVVEIAEAFGLTYVPEIMTGTIADAVRFVKTHPQSTIGTAPMEGLVGRPAVELMNRRGERVIVKVKTKDYE